MKKVKLLFLLVLFFALGCSPEEQENTENQFKPLKIRVTLLDPITQSNEAEGVGNWLQVSGTFNQSINGNIPNQVGQNSLEYNGTAAANTPIYLVINYYDMIGANGFGGLLYECNTVNLQIIYDGQVVYTESKEMGSDDGTCGDGYLWTVNYTLQ